MKKNKWRAWIEAARPKTLPASLSPVIVGCALAYRDGFFQWIPSLLCLCVALFAQIASNFANDYYDFKKGADGEERLGPERAVAQGWISPKAMLNATWLLLALTCMSGSLLLFYADWIIIPVGIAIALCVLAYSAGPFPLAYNGLGDICVLLFYGIIPVCFTYYVQVGGFSWLLFFLSLSIGFSATNILIVNNYRDYRQDKSSNKRTTIVLFGRKFGRIAYLFNGLVSLAIFMPFIIQSELWTQILFAFYFVLFVSTWNELRHHEGKMLNAVLAHTARNLLVFSILIAIFLIVY